MTGKGVSLAYQAKCSSSKTSPEGWTSEASIKWYNSNITWKTEKNKKNDTKYWDNMLLLSKSETKTYTFIKQKHMCCTAWPCHSTKAITMFTQNDKPETIEPIELHWAIRRSLLHPSLLPKTRPKKKCGERSPSGKTSTERNGSSQVLEGKKWNRKECSQKKRT